MDEYFSLTLKEWADEDKPFQRSKRAHQCRVDSHLAAQRLTGKNRCRGSQGGIDPFEQ